MADVIRLLAPLLGFDLILLASLNHGIRKVVKKQRVILVNVDLFLLFLFVFGEYDKKRRHKETYSPYKVLVYNAFANFIGLQIFSQMFRGISFENGICVFKLVHYSYINSCFVKLDSTISVEMKKMTLDRRMNSHYMALDYVNTNRKISMRNFEIFYQCYMNVSGPLIKIFNKSLLETKIFQEVITNTKNISPYDVRFCFNTYFRNEIETNSVFKEQHGIFFQLGNLNFLRFYKIS